MRSFCLLPLLFFTSLFAEVVTPNPMEIDGWEPVLTVFSKMEAAFGDLQEDQALLIVREDIAPDQVQFYCVNANYFDTANPPSPELYYRLHEAPAYRNYDNPVSPTEKSIIAYIVNTLGDASYAKLLLVKGDLEKAGAKIDHIHPLRHLSTVFSDEQLKVSARNIRRKSTVWKKYIGDLAKTLSEECGKNNITNDHVADFSRTVQVDQTQVAMFVQQHRWKDLIEYLADAVPRQGNPRRYDM